MDDAPKFDKAKWRWPDEPPSLTYRDVLEARRRLESDEQFIQKWRVGEVDFKTGNLFKDLKGLQAFFEPARPWKEIEAEAKKNVEGLISILRELEGGA